jgi:hypothetical protein
MDEIGIGRLGRRKGVGLVQEGANRDAGHQRCLNEVFLRATLDLGARKAQARKQFRFA